MQSRGAPTSAPNVTAAEAAQLLGVKAQTVYAYASRGLLRRVGLGKRRHYLFEDVERLQARQRARAGHGPVAAAALSFGDAVLDTRISGIDERGPVYRGLPALELAQEGRSFETVAELLWTGQLPAQPANWKDRPLGGRWGRARTSLDELFTALPLLRSAAPDLSRAGAATLELSLARRLVRTLASLLVSAEARGGDRSIAGSLATRCRGIAEGSATRALDDALVLIADHELNASSFAARIAASTGASLLACITAALATLSGPRHGGACDRVEALLVEASSLSRPTDVVERRAQRGDVVPGFGHPLYPHGDPRAAWLLERTLHLSRSRAIERRVRGILDIAAVMRRHGLPPTVDFALVALTLTLGMPAGSAALVFALGRSAGWIAHVLEQRESGAVLRPRARYVGP